MGDRRGYWLFFVHFATYTILTEIVRSDVVGRWTSSCQITQESIYMKLIREPVDHGLTHGPINLTLIAQTMLS